MSEMFILVLCFLTTPCLGYYQFRVRIPNGEIVPHPCKPNYMWPAVGHQDLAGGGKRNPFGVDFDLAGQKWTEELCRKDSDNDGMTNGQELGDPNCQWREGSIPEQVKGLSHPGVCTPFGEGICVGRDTDVTCEIQVVKECDVIKNSDVRHIDLHFDKIEIPPTETNYFCQHFDMPSDQDYHIVADNALLDNDIVVHHFLVFGCPNGYQTKPTDYTPNPCYMGGDTNSCSELIGVWGVGFPGACYGENVGYRIGATGIQHIKLEVHYNNPELVKGYTDQSGMRLYYQPAKPGVQNLATLVVGQVMFELPPGETNIEVSGSCPQHCSRALVTEPVYLLAAVNHMHYMGKSQKTEITRDGQLVSVVADDPRYNYDNPIQYRQETPLKILPGDHIQTTCMYSSLSRKRYVYFGDGTFDEMCLSFLTVFPAESMPQTSWCLSYGPLSTCEFFTRSPKYECDWARFANLSNPEMVIHYLNLEANCNMDGICRPECKKYVDELLQHPCLKDRGMERVVVDQLERYREGARFLGRLHSCSNRNKDFKEEVDCDASCPREPDTCPSDSGSLSTPHRNTVALITMSIAVVTWLSSKK